MTLEVVFTPSARLQFLSAIKTIGRSNQLAARRFRVPHGENVEMNQANGNSGFGWMLVIGGLVLAGIGLIWVLAPNLPRFGAYPVIS